MTHVHPTKSGRGGTALADAAKTDQIDTGEWRPSKRVSSFQEVADQNDLSIATLRREIERGKGPKVTQLSLRRKSIRGDHEAEWLNSGLISEKTEAS